MRAFLNRIAVLIVTLCVFLTGAQIFSAVAAESENEKTASGVLEDLSKDVSFNTENYLSNAKDYSLSVIQLAESADKELFIYVYQPSGDKVRASSILGRARGRKRRKNNAERQCKIYVPSGRLF